MGMMRRNGEGYSSVAAISSGSGLGGDGRNNKEKISYCHNCLQVKVLSPLKHRIYLDEQGKLTNPSPDADKWRQCWTCGTIVGVYEAKPEAELTSLTEPRSNPFKFGRGTIQAVGESRKFDRTCKTQSKKKFKQDLEQYKEEDIKDDLRKGAKLISYIEK